MQYFNIPVTKDVKDPSHPLEILKRVATPEDFVVFKLDMDHSEIEAAIVEAIVADPEVHVRIDEMFFEHHVNFEPMHRYWGTQQEKATVVDSYHLFAALRMLGVRMHGWP